MPSYFNIGKIVATYGLQGELVLLHKTGNPFSLDNFKTIFIEKATNSFLPYFVSSVRPKRDGELYIKLEDIYSKEAAGRLLQKQVYVEEKYFRQIIKEDSILYYLDFLVQDHTAGILGKVAEVVEMPSQLLLKIYQNDHELLIPLNDQTLESIDKKKRILYVNLPDGLLDIYHA